MYLKDSMDKEAFPMNVPYVEVMDLTKVASTFPRLMMPNIRRENMLMTLAEMLQTDSEVIIVEGPDGIGKTTLLAQFAQEYSHNTFSLFVRSTSRYAYDSGMLTRDLSDQISWILGKENPKEKLNIDPIQILQQNIYYLQRQANYQRVTYYFVVDGLNEIPEEDYQEFEMIMKLLPFGLPRFRFILSGPLAGMNGHSRKIGRINNFRLPGFTFEETREYFKDLITNRDTLETLHKVSRMVPGNLASVRRLLQSGNDIDQLLKELPERLPDLFELEWRVVESSDTLLRQILAILAFDRRRHSIYSLAKLCKIEPSELEKKLSPCNFVELRNDGREVEFVTGIFRHFAAERLSSLRRSVLDMIITELLNVPESPDALVHLPDFFQQTERYEDLLTYLSPKHIGNMIKCSDSWSPLHQKAELGVDTALRLKRDGDLLRFGLQRATIASMGNCQPWRSEIEAYVALDDFSAAYALMQRMVTKEDRFHLLAVIARAKKEKSLPIEVELNDQIQQLFRHIDKSSLRDRGVDIASDLIFTHPELAIELVQECTKQGDSEDRLDIALAKLSFKTFVEEKNVGGMESAHQALRERVKDPDVQKFVDTMSLFFGGYSAGGVIAEVEKWENAADRVFALCAWATKNQKREDAGGVVEYALNTILKTSTYAANAKVYRELAQPLIYIPDISKTKSIIGRLDGLKGAIEAAGPTEEYVRLQTTLSKAEARYDKQIAYNRLLDLFFYVDELIDPSTKLASLAVLAAVLKQIDPDKQYESQDGIHAAVVNDLKTLVNEIITKTAYHYEAVRPGISALARCDSKIALEVLGNLNTTPSREAAMVKFVEALAAEEPSIGCFDSIAEAYEKLKSISMRARATRVTMLGLLSNKEKLAPYLDRVIAFQKWVMDIPDAEEKCQALCMLLEMLIEHKSSIASDSIFKSLSSELQSAWDAVDLGWSKINAGFKIVALMADSFPTISRDFLKRTEQARNDMVLDCRNTAMSYIICVRLTIRCFGGLIRKKLYNDNDFEELRDLLDRIPGVSIRTLLWCELALKFYSEGDSSKCQILVSEKVRPILEAGIIKDNAALWRSIVSASPALYCAHKASARQLIDQLPQPYRDVAYDNICSFLITRRLPLESYDPAGKHPRRVSFEDYLDVYEVLRLMEADNAIYSQLESLIDGMKKQFHSRFTKPQIVTIGQQLQELVNFKFPNPDYIKHEGYKILAEAQIARLNQNKIDWDDLANQARNIPNIADSAFVLMGIAAAMPSKESAKAILLLNEARALIPQISTLQDRCNRYESLAQFSVDINKQLSKDCLRQIWKETIPSDQSELPEARRRIIDFAYRLDPEFAAGLASETDNDPGRDFAREQTIKRIDTLKLREKIAAGDDNVLKLKQNTGQNVEVARMLLASLNTKRINSVHIDFTRQFVKQASQTNLKDAYTILTWVIENAICRYSDTDQANSILRPLYEGARLSAELAFRIAARIRSVTDLGISEARTIVSNRRDLIHEGERDKALTLIKEWASNASKFIKITDPFFGLEELEFVKLIRGVNLNIPIFILTSRRHQQATKVQQPWDDTYQSHWRIKISDSDAGEVTIVVVGKSSTGEHPIHDRWWLSEKNGLRIGTSANSLGMGKLSEVSLIEESDVASRLEEVDRYLTTNVSLMGTERLKYILFKL